MLRLGKESKSAALLFCFFAITDFRLRNNMKMPTVAAVAALLLTAASLHAELGATATILQPSRERATQVRIPEGPLDSLVFGGFNNILFGSVTTNATLGDSATDSASIWSLESLRFNELNQLSEWEVKWGTPDSALEMAMPPASARLVGGWTRRYNSYAETYVGNGKISSFWLRAADPFPAFDPAEDEIIRPILWKDGEAVSLLPVGATAASVTGTSRNLQVGQAQIGNATRAIIWQGTASSALDVTPSSALEAGIAAISGSWQAGYAVFANSMSRSAVAWQGSAASFRNLHPAAASASWLLGTDGQQFVGAATMGDTTRAALWTKPSPAGFVTLHPRDALSSEAKSVAAGYQAGTVTVAAGVTHAAFWQGTAASFLDLHKALPPQYTKSEATYVGMLTADRYYVGIGGGILFGPVIGNQKPPKALNNLTFVLITFPAYAVVGGSAYNSERNRWEAVTWQVRELKPPALQTVGGEEPAVTELAKAFSVGLTRRVIVRTNGKRRIVRGLDFSRPVRVATQRGKVLRGTGKTFSKFKIKGLKPGKNDVIITATGPGGRAKPLFLQIRK